MRWKGIFEGLNFGVGLGGYGDENLGGFWVWPPASFCSGELRGVQKGGARGQKGMLLGCVVMSRSRGGVYIGAREVGRDVAGMVAMSPGASCAGLPGTGAASAREVLGRE